MNENGAPNIRYIGFESLADGRRCLEYVITAKGMPSRRATVEIPGAAFTGPDRVTFQESAAIGYERVRRELSIGGALDETLTLVLSTAEIGDYRPRRRAAAKKA